MSIAPPGIPPSIPEPAAGDETIARPVGRLAWGRGFDPTRLAALELRMKLSFILKPLFGANHRWAMARGEESLCLEVARRNAAGDPAIAAAIPEPPGPSFRWLLALRGRGRA